MKGTEYDSFSRFLYIFTWKYNNLVICFQEVLNPDPSPPAEHFKPTELELIGFREEYLIAHTFFLKN